MTKKDPKTETQPQPEIESDQMEALWHLFPTGALVSEGVQTIDEYVCAYVGDTESHWYKPGVDLVILKHAEDGSVTSSDPALLEAGGLMPVVDGMHIATTAALLDAIADEFGYYDDPHDDESAKKIGLFLSREKMGPGQFAWVLAMPDGDLEFDEAEMHAAGVSPSNAIEAAVAILAMLSGEDDEDEIRATLPPLPCNWIDDDGYVFQVFQAGKGRTWININVADSKSRLIWKGGWCPEEGRWAKATPPPKEIMEALTEQKLGPYFGIESDDDEPTVDPDPAA